MKQSKPRRLRLAFVSTVLLFQQGCLCGCPHRAAQPINAGAPDVDLMGEGDIQLQGPTASLSLLFRPLDHVSLTEVRPLGELDLSIVLIQE